MQLILIVEDPAQMLLPFAGVAIITSPTSSLQLVPPVVEGRWRPYMYEPQPDDLIWSSDDAEEAA